MFARYFIEMIGMKMRLLQIAARRIMIKIPAQFLVVSNANSAVLIVSGDTQRLTAIN